MKKQLQFDILYQDKDIIVVTKKSGLLTIKTLKDEEHNLYHYVREYCNLHREKIFIVHRLDKDTSGIVIFAKSLMMKEKLQKYFEERKVKRLYEAVIKEHIPLNESHRVVQYLFYDKKSGRVFISNDKSKGLEAITNVTSNNYVDFGTVLNINIETGRQNQIRLALHSLHYTLIGDEKYAHDKAKKMFLNEYYLEFPKDSNLKQTIFKIRPLWLKEKVE